MKKIALLFLMFLFLGCASGTPELPDGFLNQDAGVFWSEGNAHPCFSNTLDTDFYNCGGCGMACDPRNSDHCEEFECRCGLSAQCGEGADCRVGRCVSVDYEAPPGCEFDDECDVNSACLEGHCTFVECRPEVCDGIDNDCDGIVDGSGDAPLSQWCYSGAETDPRLINDPCRAGVQVCFEGDWGECIGELPPADEAGLFACNGLDDNCDLCIDGNMTPTGCEEANATGFDIVFLIDQSGSMGPYRDAVIEAVDRFSSIFNRSDFRFSLALVPGDMDGQTELVQDMTDYLTFVAALRSIEDRSWGASEPSWDAIYETGTNELGITFTPGHVRIIILFTDESGQSFRFMRLNETVMCDSLEHGEVLVVFEKPMYFEDFDQCASHLFELNSDYESMAGLLEGVIVDPCLEM